MGADEDRTFRSWIYLDVQTDGAVERWALEGPEPFNIQRRGGDLALIKPGAELGACGYLARLMSPPLNESQKRAKPRAS